MLFLKLFNKLKPSSDSITTIRSYLPNPFNTPKFIFWDFLKCSISEYSFSSLPEVTLKSVKIINFSPILIDTITSPRETYLIKT